MKFIAHWKLFLCACLGGCTGILAAYLTDNRFTGLVASAFTVVVSWHAKTIGEALWEAAVLWVFGPIAMMGTRIRNRMAAAIAPLEWEKKIFPCTERFGVACRGLFDSFVLLPARKAWRTPGQISGWLRVPRNQLRLSMSATLVLFAFVFGLFVHLVIGFYCTAITQPSPSADSAYPSNALVAFGYIGIHIIFGCCLVGFACQYVFPKIGSSKGSEAQQVEDTLDDLEKVFAQDPRFVYTMPVRLLYRTVYATVDILWRCAVLAVCIIALGILTLGLAWLPAVLCLAFFKAFYDVATRRAHLLCLVTTLVVTAWSLAQTFPYANLPHALLIAGCNGLACGVVAELVSRLTKTAVAHSSFLTTVAYASFKSLNDSLVKAYIDPAFGHLARFGDRLFSGYSTRPETSATQQ